MAAWNDMACALAEKDNGNYFKNFNLKKIHHSWIKQTGDVSGYQVQDFISYSTVVNIRSFSSTQTDATTVPTLMHPHGVIRTGTALHQNTPMHCRLSTDWASNKLAIAYSISISYKLQPSTTCMIHLQPLDVADRIISTVATLNTVTRALSQIHILY
jgi:hypothetical protein